MPKKKKTEEKPFQSKIVAKSRQMGKSFPIYTNNSENMKKFEEYMKGNVYGTIATNTSGTLTHLVPTLKLMTKQEKELDELVKSIDALVPEKVGKAVEELGKPDIVFTSTPSGKTYRKLTDILGTTLPYSYTPWDERGIDKGPKSTRGAFTLNPYNGIPQYATEVIDFKGVKHGPDDTLSTNNLF